MKASPQAHGLIFGCTPLGTAGTLNKGRGRPRKIDARLGEILNLLIEHKLSIRKIARMLDVSHMTVYRLLKCCGEVVV